MPSLISQIRNGQPRPQMQKQATQSQLDQSVEQMRGIMRQIKNAPDPQAMLAQMLQSNPNTAIISNLLQRNNDLESLAKQMAMSNNIDINDLINNLQKNL